MSESATRTAPVPPRTFVPRARLRDTLDHAAAPLTLVCAGPGTGKTALLADWARGRDDAPIWWSLSPADDVADRFWAAFARRAGGGGDTSLPVAWSPGTAGEVLAVVFAGAAPTRPRVVVLDNAHVLTDSDILDGLDLAVRRWPERVRLVLAARRDPLLPLHRYRLTGQICEVRAGDLAATAAEAAALLEAHGVPLPAAERDELLARTEGWVGGLVMAAAALAAGADRTTLLDALSSAGGGVAEYLVTEVLSRQPRRVRDLLLATSLLGQIDGEVDAELAEDVSGVPRAAELLAELSRSGSFVVPLDPAYTRFHYMPLFRDVLASLARVESPRAPDEVVARAAEWHRAKGDPVAAVGWATRESTLEHAHRLLVRGGLATAVAGEVDLGRALGPAWRRGTAAIPGSTRTERSVLTWALAAVGRDDASAAAACLAEIEGSRDEVDLSDPELELTAYVAEVVLAQRAAAVGVLDRAAGLLSADSTLARSVRAVPGLGTRVRLLRARARFAAGHPEDVEPLLIDALERVERDGPPAAHLQVLAMLAMVNASATRPSRAAAAVAQAEELLAANPGLAAPVTLDLAIARDAYVHADVPRMRAAMARAAAAGPVYADHGIAASVAFLHATLLTSTGDLAGAERMLRGSPALRDPRAGLLTVYGECELAAVVTARGRPDEALRILARHGGTPHEICGAVAAARAHLALGDVGTARAWVRRVRTVPSPHVTRLMLVEAMLCDARIDLHEGADLAALHALQQALDVAGGEVVLPFVAVAAQVAPLLAGHPALAARWPAPLPATAGVERAGDVAPSRDAGLTPREADVLALLTTGRSTGAIAEQLGVSPTTVKTHLMALYRKLDASGRRDAVRRAQERGLV